MTVHEATIEEVDEEENVNEQGELVEEISGVVMVAKMAEAHGLEPKSLVEAMKGPDWPRWQEAIEKHWRRSGHGDWRSPRRTRTSSDVDGHLS
jgi:hypothetical protein